MECIRLLVIEGFYINITILTNRIIIHLFILSNEEGVVWLWAII